MFCPALTDGAIGDVLCLFSAENPGFRVDINEGKTVFIGDIPFSVSVVICWSYALHNLIPDITKLNKMAVAANSTGIIILGGGIAKHHICNANFWVSFCIFEFGVVPNFFQNVVEKCSLIFKKSLKAVDYLSLVFMVYVCVGGWLGGGVCVCGRGGMI